MMAAAALISAEHRPRPGYRLVFSRAQQPGGLDCWIAVPNEPDPAARPLVAVHGIRRGAQEQATLFAAHAAALGRPVIAPLFDETAWPAYQRLSGSRRPDLALLQLLQSLPRRIAGFDGRFDLFGFSAGAQFAHRFAMLHPQRIARLCIAAAGWYTFPDAAAYPYGLGEREGRPDDRAARMRAALDGFLQLPIRVCVGAKDNVCDPNTRSGEAIDRQQGRDRRTRAARWAEAVIGTAGMRGILPRVALAVLPGCGHSFRRCITRGGLAELVLPGRAEGELPRLSSASVAAWAAGSHRPVALHGFGQSAGC